MPSPIATVSKFLDREPEAVEPVVEALEDAGFELEGPKTNNSSENEYWSIYEGAA